MNQLKRSPLKRGKLLKKRGPLSVKWDEFRALKLIRDCDEEGLIKCQDYKAGLPPCRIAIPNPDLHHLVGRETDPSLYFEESNLIWVVRACHQKLHNKG